MRQSRSLSALEAVSNVIVGWLVALITQLALFPVIGLQVVPWQHLTLGTVFTAVSLARSYALRRIFARLG